MRRERLGFKWREGVLRRGKSDFKWREGVLFLLPDGWRQEQVGESAYPREFSSDMYFVFSVRCLHPFLPVCGPLRMVKDGTALPGEVLPGTVLPGEVLPGEVLPGTGWLVTNASKQAWSRKKFFAMMHRFAENYGFAEYWQVVKKPLGNRIRRKGSRGKGSCRNGNRRGRFGIWRVDLAGGRSGEEGGPGSCGACEEGGWKACEEGGLSVDASKAGWRGHICFPALTHFRGIFPEYDLAAWNGALRFPLGGRKATWIPKKEGKRL